jgi:hypothetical protein
VDSFTCSSGYRRLTFMMLDADIVAVSPASVWRVLSRAGLLRKWNGKPSKKGTGFDQPAQPHQHWHIDVSYLNESLEGTGEENSSVSRRRPCGLVLSFYISGHPAHQKLAEHIDGGLTRDKRISQGIVRNDGGVILRHRRIQFENVHSLFDGIAKGSVFSGHRARRRPRTRMRPEPAAQRSTLGYFFSGLGTRATFAR